MTNNYNQYTDKYLRNSCSLVTLLNIMKYRYAIIVIPSFIMTTAIYFEQLWKRFSDSWATFSVIYKAFVLEMNSKLQLNFKVVTKQINTLKPWDNVTYGVWIKGYSTYKWSKIKKSWEITKSDIDYLVTFKWWVWHNVAWDWSWGWYLVDTDWWKNTKMSLEVLKYWHEQGLFFTNIRTINTVNLETKKVTELCIRLFQAEKKGSLDQYLYQNTWKKYLKKATKLYFYWK